MSTQSILIAVAVFASYLWIRHDSRKAIASSPDGSLLLAFGVPMRLIAILALGVTALMLVKSLNSHYPVPGLVTTGVFGALSVATALLAFGWRVLLNPSGITAKAPWRRQRYIPWNEVDTISYVRGRSEWVVKARGKVVLRIWDAVHGSKELEAVAVKYGVRVQKLT